MPNSLSFSGIRWPAAKVVARKQVVDDDPDHRSRKVPFVDTLIIETSGRGWPYSVVFVEGWWRDLAELALDDEKRVLSFLHRRGDPLGQLAPNGKQVITYDWRHLKSGARTGGGSLGQATGRNRRVALPPGEAQKRRAHVR